MVRNNIAGEEARLLKRYEEPAWNNPVVRFFAGGGRELLPRKDRVWSLAAYAPRVVAALEAAEREVPVWLRLAQAEVTGERKRIIFSMYCFWEGEARLGGLEGVVGAQAGFVGGREVVEVTYDPARIDLAHLIGQAAEMRCTSFVFAPDEESLAVALAQVGKRAGLLKEGSLKPAKDNDHLYHLRRHPALFALPATPLQRLRMNAALRRGDDPQAVLAPGQQGLLERARAADRGVFKGMTPPDDWKELLAYRSRFEQLLRTKD